ncbi:MAG TPA: 50S ribosomal protein L10 [Gemmataceae bacterium]|nr:50S ribosomal protein L10 [Gemmataceae bacterium]
MSKIIKQMQMNALKRDFDGVRDMVMLNIVGLDAIAENKMRLDLRKKGIRLQMVKNSLARRVFTDMGLKIETAWSGSTTVAWGANSVAELSKEIETFVKKNDKKMKVKTAVADGTEVAFSIALKMPTKAEALGRVVMLALSPARRVAGQIVGPASQVCGQIKGMKDMKKDEAAAEAPAASA